MSAVVVDTSVWINYFKGEENSFIDSALKDGSVYLPPLVLAELLSSNLSSKEKKEIISFLEELRPCNCDFEHWTRVGILRNNFSKRGISVSTPDAHIAQCALDLDAVFLSKDKIFLQISKIIQLKLL